MKKNKDGGGFLSGHLESWVVAPPDRPLTPEEKAHPLTFFGVTYEMRKERAAAAMRVREEKARERLVEMAERIKPEIEARKVKERDTAATRAEVSRAWSDEAKARAAEHQPMRPYRKPDTDKDRSR